jgi:hypothetical protein
LFEDLRLTPLLDKTEFPETVEDAANTLELVRTHRDELRCYETGKRLAVKQAMILIKLTRRIGGDEQEQHNTLTEIRNDLASAARDVFKADSDIGLISSVVRRKGFPLQFGPEYHGHGPPEFNAEVDTDPDDVSAVSSNFGASDVG